MGMSERFKYKNISEGYCLICQLHCKLTYDHVPPKSAGNVNSVSQILHLENYIHNLKGLIRQNGGGFKTICATCNNDILGSRDHLIKSLFDTVKSFLENNLDAFPLYQGKELSVATDGVEFCRVMLGHMLAAGSEANCIDKPKPAPYFDPIRKFVQGDDSALQSHYDIYYCYFPYDFHASARFVRYANLGQQKSMISFLKFFPISFLLCEKGFLPTGNGWRKFSPTSKHLFFNFDHIHYLNSVFPLHRLEGWEMLYTNKIDVIVSRPVVVK